VGLNVVVVVKVRAVMEVVTVVLVITIGNLILLGRRTSVSEVFVKFTTEGRMCVVVRSQLTPADRKYIGRPIMNKEIRKKRSKLSQVVLYCMTLLLNNIFTTTVI
jgi:hypothetical protein